MGILNSSTLSAAVAIAAVITARPAASQTVETFQEVEYRGGHSQFKKSKLGRLVIADTLAYWFEYYPGDRSAGKDTIWIPLKAITELDNSTEIRGATTGNKLLLGNLAGSKRDELVAIAYDTEQTAEAPVFKTKRGDSGAITAKLKFRLRRLGKLPPATMVDTSGVWQL